MIKFILAVDFRKKNDLKFKTVPVLNVRIMAPLLYLKYHLCNYMFFTQTLIC